MLLLVCDITTVCHRTFGGQSHRMAAVSFSGLPRVGAHLHAVSLLHFEILHIFALRELVHLVVFPRKRPDVPALLLLLTIPYHNYYYVTQLDETS